MNFLSHYFIDAEPGKPYHNFGLILPDLMGIYKRGWKLNGQAAKAKLNPLSSEIYRGVQKHYDLDSIFHQSDLFRENTNYILAQLNGNLDSIAMVKKHFIAHILLELLIDRVIILNDVMVAKNFYSDLLDTDLEALDNFFIKETAEHLDGFKSLVSRFRSDQYLYKYKDNEALLFALNRVMSRVNMQPVTDAPDKKLFIEVISQTQKRLSGDFLSIQNIRGTVY